jgi:hypothetical protein
MQGFNYQVNSEKGVGHTKGKAVSDEHMILPENGSYQLTPALIAFIIE